MPNWDDEVRGVLDIAIQLSARTPEEQALVDLWLQRRKIEQEKEEAAYKAEVLKAAEELRRQLRQLGEKPCA